MAAFSAHLGVSLAKCESSKRCSMWGSRNAERQQRPAAMFRIFVRTCSRSRGSCAGRRRMVSIASPTRQPKRQRSVDLELVDLNSFRLVFLSISETVKKWLHKEKGPMLRAQCTYGPRNIVLVILFVTVKKWLHKKKGPNAPEPNVITAHVDIVDYIGIMYFLCFKPLIKFIEKNSPTSPFLLNS